MPRREERKRMLKDIRLINSSYLAIFEISHTNINTDDEDKYDEDDDDYDEDVNDDYEEDGGNEDEDDEVRENY